MADPMAIITVLGLGHRVLHAIYVYVREVRHVPEIVVDIQARMATWEIQLKALEILEESGDLTDQAKTWLNAAGVLRESRECLEGLHDLLAKAPRPVIGSSVPFSEHLRRLKWPGTSQKRANDLLDRLDRQREEIQRCLMTETS